jgi:hypothetical protein
LDFADRQEREVPTLKLFVGPVALISRERLWLNAVTVAEDADVSVVAAMARKKRSLLLRVRFALFS